MKKFTSLLMLAAVIAAPAYAQEEHQIQGEISVPGFEAADKDGDGFLGFTEAVVLFPSLTLTDADEDGYLSELEAKAVLPTLAFEDEHEDDHRIGPGEYEMMAEIYVDTFQTAQRY